VAGWRRCNILDASIEQEGLVLARLEQALESVVGSVDDEIVSDSQLEFAVWDRVKIAGPLDGQHLDAVLP
jgi:hypothetical protein